MKAKIIPFTVDELNAMFEEREPGVLYWLKRPYRSRVDISIPAGSKLKSGYTTIMINKEHYLRHRLIWYIHTGKQPFQIDHINGTSAGDGIDNLQDIDQARNCWKRSKMSTNTSGYTGVYYSKANNNWCSEIMKNGKKFFLGTFDTPEEAHEAYLEAKKVYHEGFETLK